MKRITDRIFSRISCNVTTGNIINANRWSSTENSSNSNNAWNVNFNNGSTNNNGNKNNNTNRVRPVLAFR